MTKLMSCALALTCGLILTTAASAEIRVTPKPGTFEKRIQVTSDVVKAEQSSFPGCNPGMRVLLTPVATVTFEENAKYRIAMRKEFRHGSLQFAIKTGEKYWCSESGTVAVFDKRLPKGTYTIFAMGSEFRLESNQRLAFTLFASMATPDRSSPTVQADFSATNPTATTVEFGGDLVSFSLVAPRLKKQLKQNRRAYISATPIGTLKITRQSTYAFSPLPHAFGLAVIGDRSSALIESWDGGISLSHLKLGPGTYRLFAVAPESTKKQSATLFVRDTKEPTTANPHAVAAADAQIVDFQLGQQTVVKATMKDSVGGWKSQCGYQPSSREQDFAFAFPKKAPLVVKIDKGTKGMVIDYVYNSQEMALAISSKNSESRCFFVRDDKSPASMAHYLDPGTYYISAGFKAGYTGEAALMVREASTPVSAESFVREIPETLSAKDREVSRYMPFVVQMNPGREELSRIFAELPRSLWFYARYDLDGAVAKYRSALSRGILPDADDLKGLEYPKAGEPLLKIGSKFVSADGLIFAVSSDAVVSSFGGAPTLPKKMRNVSLSLFGDDLQYANASFLKKVDALAKTKEKFRICYRKYLQKHGGYTNLQEVTFRGNKVVSVESLGSKAARNGFARCRGKRVEATERRLVKQLTKDFSRRGKKRLAALRQKMDL